MAPFIQFADPTAQTRRIYISVGQIAQAIMDDQTGRLEITLVDHPSKVIYRLDGQEALHVLSAIKALV